MAKMISQARTSTSPGPLLLPIIGLDLIRHNPGKFFGYL